MGGLADAILGRMGPGRTEIVEDLRDARRRLLDLVLDLDDEQLAVPLLADRYVTILLTDIFCFALFAVSLHFIMGPAGMVSFGHAVYFGLGAYAAGLALKRGGLPMEAALVLAPFAAGAFALVYGWFCVRLSGVYLAMLTLAFAQISWSIVFQWDSVTGGSNGVFGVWPSSS